ncbi:carbohydrate ABC transporter permease [Halopelagius fulvigenes]|uniref:Carbohydrate ABC transporter permease n=1 Tax=Halopelagius fulvigenes TaxID=1198324 RepID=A0ABD5TYI6_9EURY
MSQRFNLRLDGDNIPGWESLSYGARKRLLNKTADLLILFSVLIVVVPLFWMLSTSLRPTDTLFNLPTPILPQNPTLEAFDNVINNSNFTTWYFNSIIVAVGVVTLTTVTSTLAGYGLTRLDIPYKKTFARIILFGYMFPAILLAIPMFIFWRQLGWIDSHLGLVFAETAVSLPFGIWMMWKFFQTVPVSLEESAQMAGASRFRAFYEIALPMAKPGMVAVAVFSYAVAWNEFTMPTILLVNNESWVLTIGLFSFTMQNQVLWSQLMAASTLTVIPSFIFVYFLQKYLLRGFRAGGIG